MVIACDMPECPSSGATTTTFPKGFTISTSASIPAALNPSSLVTSIVGLFSSPFPSNILF